MAKKKINHVFRTGRTTPAEAPRLGGCVLRSITRLIRQCDLRRWHEDVRVLSDSAVVSPVKRRADEPGMFPNRSLRYGETTATPTQRVRIGTQDLKIACTALANDALLLSANLRNFEQVPGLRVEDWLH